MKTLVVDLMMVVNCWCGNNSVGEIYVMLANFNVKIKISNL